MPKKGPNIVMIMSDDLGYEVIGANGGTSYATPRLDGMAENGMRFEEGHVLPLCTPTRVALMTGKHNFRNYIGFGLIPPDEVTFGIFSRMLDTTPAYRASGSSTHTIRQTRSRRCALKVSASRMRASTSSASGTRITPSIRVRDTRIPSSTRTASIETTPRASMARTSSRTTSSTS